MGDWAPNENFDPSPGPVSTSSKQTGGSSYYRCKGDSSACGPKDDPTFQKCKTPTYSGLEKKPTQYRSYKESAVIAAIKASGQPEHVQKIMFAFVVKEQPRFNFPNNNVAGIQLDGAPFGGTSQSDFDYQTCFRDGGGDQRIFAGFETLEKGMVVFGKSINGKLGVFKIPPGNSLDEDADILTWNYYRQWNLALSPEQLEELKKNGQIEKRGRVYKKDWAKVTASFIKSLAKWESA